MDAIWHSFPKVHINFSLQKVSYVPLNPFFSCLFKSLVPMTSVMNISTPTPPFSCPIANCRVPSQCFFPLGSC